MKIAIVCDRVYPFFKGGVEKRYWELAQSLVDAGHEVHYYTGQWDGMDKTMVIDNINLYGVYKVKNFYQNGRKSIKESIIFSFSVFKHLLKGDYDVIDCDQFPLLHVIPVKIISMIRGKKMILTWHETWGSYWINYVGFTGSLGMLAEFIVTKLPHKVISVSEHTTEGLINITKTSSNKITTIPMGLNIKNILSTQPAKTPSTVIFVGRLISHKNIDSLIKAISIIKQYETDIKCLIVGDGPEKEALKQIVADLNLENNIEILSNVQTSEEVYSLMKNSEVFVLPSTREGFGITVIEANACGLPVVTVDHQENASNKLISPGVNGYVTTLEPESLASSINKARENYHHMTEECVEFAKNFDWNEMKRKTLEVYTLP